MPDFNEMNTSRRSFFKWSLLGLSAFAASLSPVVTLLADKDKMTGQNISELTDAATVITDASQGCHHRLITSQHFVLANPINAKDGQRIVWEIVQDATGKRRMTLDDKFIFGSDLKKATLSTAPNKRDFLTAIYNAPTDQWHVVAFIRGY